jgi:hypothetical protein
MIERSVKEVFGLILLLMTDKRKKIIDHLCSFRDILNLYTSEKVCKQATTELMLRKYTRYSTKESDSKMLQDEDKQTLRKIHKSDGTLYYSEPDMPAPIFDWKNYKMCILELL